MEETAITVGDIRFSAMNLLALREHTVMELKNKLGRKFPSAELIELAVQSLIEQGLQSDERFTLAFIGMRQRQGKGPAIIKMELREKGVAAELITSFIDDADILWSELAIEVWRKKFRGAVPQDNRERAKQMRFLQSRGFTGQQIRAVFAATDGES